MRGPKYFAVWPSDPEATGPYQSPTGRVDIFSTRARAEGFMRRWIADSGATVREIHLASVAVDPQVDSTGKPTTRV
jgi:hypothetical protein